MKSSYLLSYWKNPKLPQKWLLTRLAATNLRLSKMSGMAYSAIYMAVN